MPRPKTRTNLLQRETIWEMKNLFGNAKNAYRNLKPFDKNIGWYAFARLMRHDEGPQPHVEVVEQLWEDYKDLHNFGSELNFEPQTEDDFPAVKRTRATRGPGQYMEEDDDDIVQDFVEFDE
jgi:hypothetical protein